MDVLVRGADPDSAGLNAVAELAPEWPHGALQVRRVARIGADHGLSGGEVFRVVAETERSGDVSFVVKREPAQAVERALLFHRSVGPLAAGSVPACLGGLFDHACGRGVLLLEDVAPARQGDVLRGCTDVEAESAVRSLARVHAASWNEAGETAAAEVPRWVARPTPSDEWARRLSAAADRFPRILTAPLTERLRQLPRRVERAIESLRNGERCWTHGDAHLDNVLFRPDGTAVLLDWSGAAVGPPAVDLARLLTEGMNAGGREELLAAYADELTSCGMRTSIAGCWDALSDGLALVVQAAVGWAVRDETREPQARMHALQENFLRGACAWMEAAATVER